MFSDKEKQQYNRHLILPEIGEVGQQKLKNAKVLVVGAGGLGCPVLQYLTAAGVGLLGIVDGDEISQSNLQRQILFSVDDIGKLKVEVAKQKLERLNPFVSINVFTEFLSRNNAIEIIKQFDIVVDTSDNFPTRYLVNDACVIAGKPLVFGSIFKFEGQVSVFNYNNSATYRCLFPTPPKAGDVPNCSEIGVLGVLPGIIGCLQANEVLKIICEVGEVLAGKLLTYNALSMEQIVFNYQRTAFAQLQKLEDDYTFFCGLTVFEEITRTQFESNKTQYHLLDVRTYQERESHHIGGQHIPLNELEERFSEIQKGKPLIVYCRSGNRSKKAILFLKQNLNLELLNLTNGIG